MFLAHSHNHWHSYFFGQCMKTILPLILCFSLSSFAQKCEWVKTFTGMWQNSGPMGDHNLLSDKMGNVYIWGGTDDTLSCPDFTFTAPTQFVASFNSHGALRWIRTATAMMDVDVDPDGHTWILTQTELIGLDSSGQQQVVISHPVTQGLRSVKSAQGSVYAVGDEGDIFKYDHTGSLIASRTGGPIFTRVLKHDSQGLHVLGTYGGSNVSIDGHPLPDVPTPCNCISAFYTVLDQDLKATCAGQTSGSAHKTLMTAAFVTSGGNYVNATHHAYDASEILLGNCEDPSAVTTKISIHLGNSVNAFADSEDGFFCAHTARAEPSGCRLSVFRFNSELDFLETLEWDGLTASGIATSPGALFVSGTVQDSTGIDGFKMIPQDNETYFLAKFSQPMSGVKKQNIRPALRVYPNPFHASATIDLEGWDKNISEVNITDITGKKLKFPCHVSGGKIYLESAGFAPGIYFCRLHGINSETVVLKLVVE